MQTERLAAFFEGLNSSLAQSTSELGVVKWWENSSFNFVTSTEKVGLTFGVSQISLFME